MGGSAADGTVQPGSPRRAVGADQRAIRPPGRVLTARGGVLGGIAAGLVGIGCCAGPVVAALLGFISASSAVSLADSLYSHWEWAFLTAGAVTAAVVVITARQRARSCTLAPGRRRRFLLLVAVSALVTYGALYLVTTLLGHVAS